MKRNGCDEKISKMQLSLRTKEGTLVSIFFPGDHIAAEGSGFFIDADVAAMLKRLVAQEKSEGTDGVLSWGSQ